MKAMWDRSGVLFLTNGTQADPTAGKFAYSENGAASWTVHPDITNVSDFSWGAKLNWQSFPTLYFYGCVNNNTLGNNGYGLYASDDNLANVRKLNSGPIGKSFDWACSVGASRKHKDFVVIGFDGSTGAACFPVPEGRQVIWHG